MKLKAFLFLLAVIGVIALVWLSPASFRPDGNRETKAAAMEQEIRRIQSDYNVDYVEALEMYRRRQRER
jgi:hypothetical protein